MLIVNKPCRHCNDLKSAHLNGKCLFGPQKYNAYPHAMLEAAVLLRIRVQDATPRIWHKFDFFEHTLPSTTGGGAYYSVNCLGTVIPRVVYVYPDEFR